MKKTGMMEIALCNGIVVADAKTGLVDLKTIEKIGMAMKGVEKASDFGNKRLDRFLNSKDTEEFLFALHTKRSNGEFAISTYWKEEGKRNKKVWGDIFLALKYAMHINKELEVEVLETFIDKKILDFRLLGIDYFKELNEKLDTLEDRVGKDNKGVYIQISKAINTRCNGEFIKGWDISTATTEIQTLRSDILKMTKQLIDMKMLKTYEDVKNFINNYK